MTIANRFSLLCRRGGKHLDHRFFSIEVKQRPISFTIAPESPQKHEIWKSVEPLSKRLCETPKSYGSLSKLKLAMLVVSTTFAGYIMGPLPFSSTIQIFLPENISPLLCTLVGTALCSFSANAFNQWIEVPLDSQMARTKCRVMPIHKLSPFHAFNYALLSGIIGITLLAAKVNWLTATLALINIGIYTVIYTPLKRVSILNTWIGAIVGAIPPMIGWAGAMACNPHSHLLDPAIGLFPGGFALAAVLYCWQFPHFNSLSWNLRGDYSRAGYCMASVLNPSKNLNTALLYSLALIPITISFPYLFNLTSTIFAYDANLLNLIMAFYAYKFRKNPSRNSARTLFFFSLLHLPLFMVLLVFHKHSSIK